MPFWVIKQKSADPVQMPQDAASDQGQHCLLAGNFMQNAIEMKTSAKNPFN